MALKNETLKEVRQRTYLARDFDSLRNNLLNYARTYYPDRIKDFSEASLGGLWLDLAASVGDNLSFYLDHQYGELSYETAVENVNIERILRTAGVPIVGAAPALVPTTVFINVPATSTSQGIVPDPTSLPKILAGSVFASDSGIEFVLLEDIDFTEENEDGNLAATIKINEKTSAGVPTSFILTANGLCISGKEATETFDIGSFQQYRKITLTNANVSEIVSVYDDLGNTYFKVNALTHDVVYRNVLNTNSDTNLVKDVIKLVPAPYRYVVNGDLSTRKSILTFGGGNANTLEDDIIPDPSEFAISFPYQTTFSRISVNPEQLLQTKTLGVASENTTLTITYRYGGGLDHNVPANTIKNVKTLKTYFPQNPTAQIASSVRSSLEVTNRIRASGGEDAPTVDDLKSVVPSIRNSQERIVSREDLLARVYTIPSNFGRVFRAAIKSNPQNPLAAQLFIVSRDNKSNLITSPDTLKKNLVRYLAPYRMISDAIDILDAKIINYQLIFDVIVDPSLNKSTVIQNILKKLVKALDVKNFHIDQPIAVYDIVGIITSTPGVISLNNMPGAANTGGIKFVNVSGLVGANEYSDIIYDLTANARHGLILPPAGGIFECRYVNSDIIGKATI